MLFMNKNVFNISLVLFLIALLSIIIQFTVTYDKPLALYGAISTVICSVGSLLFSIVNLVVNKNETAKKIKNSIFLIVLNTIIVLLMIGNIYFLFRYRAGNLYI